MLHGGAKHLRRRFVGIEAWATGFLRAVDGESSAHQKKKRSVSHVSQSMFSRVVSMAKLVAS